MSHTLPDRLRHPVRFGAESQEQAMDRHFKERKEAANEIENLRRQRDGLLAALKLVRQSSEWSCMESCVQSAVEQAIKDCE